MPINTLFRVANKLICTNWLNLIFMKQIIFFLYLVAFHCSTLEAQPLEFDIPEYYNSHKQRIFDFYYHAGLNKIIVNEKIKKGLAHYLFDTSFNLVASYERKFSEEEVYNTKMPMVYARPINIGKDYLEVYASDTAVAIHKLDFNRGLDTTLALANYVSEYKKAKLLTIIPLENGCIFLCLVTKKKNARLLLYRWQSGNSVFEKSEYILPESTLPLEDKKHYKDILALDYKTCFNQVSVSHVNHPDLFQLPAPSQLFYNDSVLYLVNHTAHSTGINVLTINYLTKQLRSKNYFLNEFNRNKLGTYNLKFPVATVYDSVLIIENCSDKVFEYHFFNIVSGAAIRSYGVNVQDSLSILVHSPYRQLNTSFSSATEKELNKESLFIRRKNDGIQFIKPLLAGDSLLLTFGSINNSPGVGGILVAAATGAMGYMAYIHLGNMRIIPYLLIGRNKFIYAHSKFSVADWRPSPATNISSFIDQFVAADKFSEATSENSALIDMHDKLYLVVYNNKSMKYTVSKFYQ